MNKELIFQLSLLLLVTWGFASSMFDLVMQFYLQSKVNRRDIKYKEKPTCIIKCIYFNGLSKIELVVFDHGLAYTINCKFKDLYIF